MSEQDQEQRTEEPTDKRLTKARDDGKVIKSQDVITAGTLLLIASMLEVEGDRAREGFLGTLRESLAQIRHGDESTAVILATQTATEALKAVTPLLLVLFPLALALNFAQFGAYFVPNKLGFKPERMMPNLGPTTFLNAKSLLETFTSLLKLGAFTIAGYIALESALPQLIAATDPVLAGSLGFDAVHDLLRDIGLAMLVIGGFDYFFKRRQHFKDLRMTKEEVKQEAKDAQGDQHIKARIRGRQKQMALQRMMEEVPKATVVVTNPTHYAVALQYESAMGAPRVVAKGVDHLALRIRKVAKEAGVPIVENPPLARALHAAAEVGSEIPPTLYKAVAELLAAIFKTRNRVRRATT